MDKIIKLAALAFVFFSLTGAQLWQSGDFPPNWPSDGDQWVRHSDLQLFTYDATYSEWLGQPRSVEFGNASFDYVGKLDFSSRSTSDTTTGSRNGAAWGYRTRITAMVASHAEPNTINEYLSLYAVNNSGVRTLSEFTWNTRGGQTFTPAAGDTLTAAEALAMYTTNPPVAPNAGDDPAIVVTFRERVIAPTLLTTATVALPDLIGDSTYQGYHGGLYSDNNNTIPAAHAGRQPTIGATETIVAIGMSSAKQIFDKVISAGSGPAGWTYINACLSVRTVDDWADSTSTAWDLAQAEIIDSSKTAADVTVLWACMAADLRDSLPAAMPYNGSQAITLAKQFAEVLRIAKTEWPNLKVVLITAHPRVKVPTNERFTEIIYEPQAYEDQFAVRWLVEEAIWQQDGNAARRFGDLTEAAVGWIDWGFCGWATSTTRTYDGYSWPDSYIQGDNIHPAALGETVFAVGITAILNAL